MLTRTDTALDRPMILFQDVVEILHRSMSTVLPQNTGGFELNDGWRISSVLVGIDYPRRGMVLPAQGFGQKPLSRCCVAFSRQKEVDRRTGGVDSPVQVYPLPLTRTYVSSTRQESLVGLSLERKRRSNSGA